MSDSLKTTFVLREVQRYVAECEAAMKLAMARLKIGQSGELQNSMRSQARSSGKGAVGELMFKEYGRFVDMGVGRGQPLGSLSQTKVELQASRKEGLAFMKATAYKPKKFYSPIVYGKLNYLQNRLLYGYTQETIDALKKEMEGRQP